MNNNLNRLSTPEQKRSAAEAVYELLSDFFFEQVNFLNSPGTVTSGDVTSTSNYGMALRVPDTSKGKYIRPDKKSKFRCLFYYEDNLTNTDGYILSPCVYQSSTAPTNVSQFNSYLGIKVLSGNVSLVSKIRGREQLFPTQFKITDDTTYLLEMDYSGNTLNVSIDGALIGSVSGDFSDTAYSLITVYPIIAPIRSVNGSTVKITFENYQYLQDK